MSDLRIVSTYNPAQWDEYVHRNIQSWLEHVDGEFVIYHEGDRPALERDRIVWRQWEDIPGALDFAEECAAFPAARGRFGNGYDYNFDAHKFARKVWAQCDAAEEAGDLLVWFDADVEVTRNLGAEVFEDLLLGMPMARYDRPGYHSETGIVVWDQRRPEVAEFFRGYRTLYANRRIFCLPKGWHDCWALDWVVGQMGLPTASLTHPRRGDFSSPHANLHVVPESELGRYLRHDKGLRKHAA